MRPSIQSFLIQFLFLFGSIFLANLEAQAEEPELIPYLINDYDVHNQTWSISQNQNNYLVYLANSEGLMEFNGINWTKYPLKDRLPIRSVAVHPNGKIYTGTFEDFGFWEHNSDGELQYQSLSHLTEMEKNDEIWKIYILDQKIYFQSFTSIYIYNNSLVEKVMAPYAMLFLHQIENQFIVQIIDSGLYWFENNKFEHIKNSNIFSNKKVHSIIPYGKKQWLVCTDNYGIYLFDGSKFSYFDSEASRFLKNNICNTAKRLNDSTFVFGSILNGLIISNKQGDILRSYNTHNGLKNNTVLSLFADNESGLWIGLDEGVNYIDLLSPFTHYKSRNASFGTIYALLIKDKQLYIGSNHGLFLGEIEKQGQFYYFKNIRLIPNSQGQVWSLEEFDNQVICGHNEGTFLVTNESLELLSSVTGGWTYTPMGDYLLGGTYTGIVVLKKSSEGNWMLHSKLENFTEPTRYIEVDYLGYIWASHHQKGIYRIEISEDFTKALKIDYFPDIKGRSHNIKVFQINNRVVFTTTENIYTFDYLGNQIIPIDSLSKDLGLYKTATQIQNYNKNEYWLIKDDKLALFEINLDFSATKKCEIQLNNISLPQRNIQLVNLDSTNLIIPTPQSFDIYNLTYSKIRQSESRLKIEKIVFYGKKDLVVNHFKFFINLRTPWNMNNVRIHFIAPYSFDQPPKKFQYRIKELDSNWQSTINNQFTYIGLKYGKYTVEILSPEGSIAQVSFFIEKPWYISRIALFAYFVALATFAWLLTNYFKYKLNRQKEIVAMELKQSSLEKELDYKNYELMLTIRYLINKNEILTELQKEINDIKVHSSKYPIKNLRSMENIINEGLLTQTDEWMNAMKSLKLSEQGFFKKLTDRYPNLTTNDLRLCSYLKMNFSTKEIARLLNNSPRAIEISRYRLRKKLNLKNDINLTEFLMSETFEDDN
jgi:DNA-binding CsgD family transcriptional regulator